MPKTIERFLAEKVFGWEHLEVDYFSNNAARRQIELEPWLSHLYSIGQWDGMVGNYYIDVAANMIISVGSFRPSERMDDAWRVIDHMESEGYDFRIVSQQMSVLYTHTWECIVSKDNKHSAATAQEAPNAICAAILRYKTVWETPDA